MTMGHTLCWTDIPVNDLDRAIRFYSEVLGQKVDKQEAPGFGAYGLLPHAENQVSGCLAQSPDNKPSQSGPLIYLAVNGRLDAAVTAVEKQGGKVLQGKHPIGPYGYRAIIADSEGNRIALHSQKD
jgi:predicted enzyme related to lactoylglutathione lyase